MPIYIYFQKSFFGSGYISIFFGNDSKMTVVEFNKWFSF